MKQANIKIIPYPNLKITEECFKRDVVPNTATIENGNPSKAEVDIDALNLMIVEFQNGSKRVVRPGPPVSSENKKYFSVFPNPVHLYLDLAIDHFNHSENIKRNSFPVCAKKKPMVIDGASFLDIDMDETHVCYNEFFKLRMSSIIMLSTSVEAFINHSIPSTYPDREDIERYGKFKDKLNIHLPKSLNLVNFWDDKIQLRDAIMSLYYLRNDLIHLKTNSQDGFVAYFTEIEKMLKYNILYAIKDVTTFMNAISPNFIESLPSK